MTSGSRARVLFVHHAATVYGASRSLLESVRAVSDERDVWVTLPRRGPLAELLEREGARCVVLPPCAVYYCSLARSFSAAGPAALAASVRYILLLPFRAAAHALALAALVRRIRPETVVINSATLLVSGWTARKMGLRVVWHVREILSTERSAAIKRTIAGVLRGCADRLIVNSEYSRNDLESLGVRAGLLIPNGVDTELFRPSQPGTAEAAPLRVVGFAGQISRQKGWRVLLEAAFILAPKFPDVKFLLVGADALPGRAGRPGREERLLRRAVAEMRLEGRVILAGEQGRMNDWYARMDCLAAPSTAPESFGRVLIEAMACGLPVIASDLGAYREIVLASGGAGLLVEPGDPRALAAAVELVLTRQEAARSMSLAGRRRAEESYDSRSVRARLRQAYLERPATAARDTGV